MLTKRTFASNLQDRWVRGCRVLVGALLLWSTATALAATAPTSAATTHLVGTILDASGKPAKGALVGIAVDQRVLLELRGSQYLYVTADANGRFDLALPSVLRTVTVVARRPGSAAASSQPVALSGARREMPPLQLAQGLTLTGRVVDEQRRPIVGAFVQAVPDLGLTDTIRFNPEPTRSTTNRDGRFELPGLQIGGFMVSAYSNTHALSNTRHEVSLAPASRQLQITLKTGVYLSGTVLDVAGQPIAGVKLTNSVISAASDVRGGFRLGPFAPDAGLGIEVQRAGYTPLHEEFTAPRSDLVLVLERTATLRGRVFDAATNRPVPGFQVSIGSLQATLFGADTGIAGPRSFNTRDGRFELSNVSAGPLNITVQARGYLLWESLDFEFRGGTTHELTIAMTKGMSLPGRLIDKMSGRALPGAEVSYALGGGVYAINPGTTPPPVITDAAGTFLLEGLPAGTLTVNATARGYQSVSQKVNVEGQNFLELAASRSAVIRGQVFAADGVTPVQAMVMLERLGSIGHETDDQGHFEFAQEEPGRYQLLAEASNGRSESKEVTVVEGQMLEGVILRVIPAATVRGRLSGVASGEPLQVGATDFMVERFDAMLVSPLAGKVGEIDADGTYRVQGLAGGAIAVIAGSRTRSIVKKIEMRERGEATLDFDFADVRVTGRVTRNGQGVPQVGVVARPLDGQLVSAIARTTATGEYALCELAPGRYSIAAAGAKAVNVQVTAGMVQNFELAPFDLAGRAVDAATGRGLAEVSAQLLPLSEGGTDRNYPGFFDLSPLTNAKGEFSLEEITAGEYQLVLYRSGYDLAEQRIVVKSSIADLAIAMQPSEGVRLRVHGPAEEIVNHIGVTAPSRSGHPMQLSVKLDRYGVGQLPLALAGRSLQLQSGSYEPYVVERWNGAPLNIELRPGSP